mmetsp:Transcript_9021/g.29622  ORF Transcript_9021/g.29622 Transcript_9021/m.29622 type:complete len:200 (+) Transcript_9021:591-1190(+)
MQEHEPRARVPAPRERHDSFGLEGCLEPRDVLVRVVPNLVRAELKPAPTELLRRAMADDELGVGVGALRAADAPKVAAGGGDDESDVAAQASDPSLGALAHALRVVEQQAPGAEPDGVHAVQDGHAVVAHRLGRERTRASFFAEFKRFVGTRRNRSEPLLLVLCVARLFHARGKVGMQTAQVGAKVEDAAVRLNLSLLL